MNNNISELIEEHMDNVEKAARRYYRAMSDAGRSVDTFCDKCAAKTLERIEEKRKARRELSAQEYLEKYVKTVPLN